VCCRLQLLGVVSLWAALSHGINLRKSLKGKNIGLLCTDMCFNCIVSSSRKNIYLGISRVHPAVQTDKKENQSLLIYKEIWNGAVAKSYMTKYLRISSYIRNPFLIYDFTTAPF
jgi:hypothetical protein